MNDTFIKWFTDFNAFLIRVTRGRIGSQLGTQSILVLHTTGRKTGQPRSAPVAYFEHEGRYLLVGSNWGRSYHADWLLNLRKQPRAQIDVNGRSYAVHAREAEGDEYTRLWQYVTEHHPPYLRYQEMTSRRIPIVVLEHASSPYRPAEHFRGIRRSCDKRRCPQGARVDSYFCLGYTKLVSGQSSLLRSRLPGLNPPPVEHLPPAA